MWLTIAALVITTLVALIEVVTGNRSRRLKAILATLAVAGFAAGVLSSAREAAEKEAAKVAQLKSARDLDAANSMLQKVLTRVGDETRFEFEATVDCSQKQWKSDCSQLDATKFHDFIVVTRAVPVSIFLIFHITNRSAPSPGSDELISHGMAAYGFTSDSPNSVITLHVVNKRYVVDVKGKLTNDPEVGDVSLSELHRARLEVDSSSTMFENSRPLVLNIIPAGVGQSLQAMTPKWQSLRLEMGQTLHAEYSFR